MQGGGTETKLLNGEYESVIGLEVHAQMLTATKAFCGCSAVSGAEPNTRVCPVCLGMPGTLPVLNKRLVEFAILMGCAVHAAIPPRSLFARKNYFYPDLPKGYQISQYDLPLCSNGWLEIEPAEGIRKRIGITRIHLEEDAGKLIHDAGSGTLVDANRCGVPLLEIVTEPDLRSAREASLALTAIHQLVTYLGICDGNMERGNLRCDANVSVRRRGAMAYGTKTEVKNMNSFRNVERAVEYEINRQVGLIADGGRVVQETLLWDADRGMALPMRGKEEAHDYRYFPEPDLVPIVVDDSTLASVRARLPELPLAKRERFVREFGLPGYDAGVLTAERPVAEYLEQVVAILVSRAGGRTQDHAKQAGNWVMTEVLRIAGERKLGMGELPVTPEHLAGLILLINDGTINGTIAKEVFAEMAATGREARGIVEEKGLSQLSDAGAIAQIVDEVLRDSPQQTAQHLAGNTKVFGFLVGETMKRTKGKANPRLVNELLRTKLDALRG